MNTPKMKWDEEILFIMPETAKNENKKVDNQVEKIISIRY
jgi:hypothetical protein